MGGQLVQITLERLQFHAFGTRCKPAALAVLGFGHRP